MNNVKCPKCGSDNVEEIKSPRQITRDEFVAWIKMIGERLDNIEGVIFSANKQLSKMSKTNGDN